MLAVIAQYVLLLSALVEPNTRTAEVWVQTPSRPEEVLFHRLRELRLIYDILRTAKSARPVLYEKQN